MAMEEGIWEKRIHFLIQTSVFLGQEEDDWVPSGSSHLSGAVLQYDLGSEVDGILVSI